MKLGGKRLQRFVLELEVAEQTVVSEKLMEVLRTGAKHKREEAFDKIRSEKGEVLGQNLQSRIRDRAEHRSKMKLAIKGIDAGIEASFMKNIHKMTKKELLWSILPRGSAKRGRGAKRKRQNKASGDKKQQKQTTNKTTKNH